MINIQEYVDIKEYSTLKTGGQFRYFTTILSKEDLSSVYAIAHKELRFKDIPIFILGGGSNVVFSDGVVNVFAVKMEIMGFEVVNETEDYVDIEVGAGEIWDKIVEKTVEMNLSGFEALSAIPGTVGAGPVQNIGAYGVEVKDTILEVEVFDIENEEILKLSNKDCKFGYRDSIFKNEAKGKYIITGVTYRLHNIKKQEIIPSKKVLGSHRQTLLEARPDHFYNELSPSFSYPGVKKYFENKGIENPDLKQIREAIIEIRSEKLPNPKEIPNVGSFFKNPIVASAISDKIKEQFPDAKFFIIDNQFTKIPAGWLIENAGLKGKSFGNVSVYDKNALVLINNGNATKEDIMKVKNEIIKIVQEKFGIVLEQEPEVV